MIEASGSEAEGTHGRRSPEVAPRSGVPPRAAKAASPTRRAAASPTMARERRARQWRVSAEPDERRPVRRSAPARRWKARALRPVPQHLAGTRLGLLARTHHRDAVDDHVRDA